MKISWLYVICILVNMNGAISVNSLLHMYIISRSCVMSLYFRSGVSGEIARDLVCPVYEPHMVSCQKLALGRGYTGSCDKEERPASSPRSSPLQTKRRYWRVERRTDEKGLG